MIRLFTRREMISLILIIAVGALGLWAGASQGGTVVVQPIAEIMFAVALALVFI